MSKPLIESRTTSFEHADRPGHNPQDLANRCEPGARYRTSAQLCNQISRPKIESLTQTRDEFQYSLALADLSPASNQLLNHLLPGLTYSWLPRYRVALLQQWAEETLKRPRRSLISDCYAIAILCRCEIGLHDEAEIVINFENVLEASAATITRASAFQVLKLLWQTGLHGQAGSSLMDLLGRSACANALSKLVTEQQLVDMWDRDLVYKFLVGWRVSESLLQRAMSMEYSGLPSRACKDLPQLLRSSCLNDAHELLNEYKIEAILEEPAQLCLSQRVFAQVIVSLSAIESNSAVLMSGLNRQTALLRLFCVADYLRTLSLIIHSGTEMKILNHWIHTIEGHLASAHMHVVASEDNSERDLVGQIEVVDRFLEGAYLCEN